MLITGHMNDVFPGGGARDEILDFIKTFRPKLYDEAWVRQSNFERQYREYFAASNYIRFEVHNRSSKTLKRVTLSARSVKFYQVDAGKFQSVESDQTPLQLGDLQPRRTMQVHVLVSNLWSFSIEDLKSHYTFSAEEMGPVSYDFPIPELNRRHIKDRFYRVVSWIGFTCSIGGSVAFGISVLQQLR